MHDLVRRIADAVLYEGYILYPYRPSVKNRQRWTFGGLYPAAFCERQRSSDAASSRTECLVEGSEETSLHISVRFLHLIDRTVGAIDPPPADWPNDAEPAFRAVESLRVGDRDFYPWQEAEERQIELEAVSLEELPEQPRRQTFRFPARRWLEPLRRPDGKIVGVLAREQKTLAGTMNIEAAHVADHLYKLTLRIVNETPLEGAADASRDDALLRSLVSTHAILRVRSGVFVSLLDPPERCRDAAAACRNVGVWPVLVGAAEDRTTMLASPIILYDYPQIAPESPGDLFDGTEIDEILTLRILTLTDEEKRAAAAVDERARDLLARAEALTREQLMGLHGAMRELRPVPGGDS